MRQTILSILLLCSIGASQAETKPLVDNSRSPYMPIKSIGMSDCKWDGGFWGDRFKVCSEVMIPNMWELVNNPKLSHIYENFLVAAGEKEGVFRGFLFGDGDFYKFVEAMCYDYAISKDQELLKHINQIAMVIAKAQLKNGYLTTGKIIGKGSKMNFDHTEGGALERENKFIADRDHELYNFGHLITLGCIHYRTTGSKILLDVAIKAADCLDEHFGVPSPELAAIHWNPPHFMALVELYRTTGESRYLELTKTFINMLGTTKYSISGRGLDHSQKRIPFQQERHAVGHAVHANYMYCGIADYIAESGDWELGEALDAIWSEVVNQKMYITGATGSHDRTVSHDAVVGEAYGATYDLPNTRGYSETCANIGNAMWNWRMFLATGEAKYIEVMELALYNSVLAGISLDGKHFYYQNPLRFIEEFKGSHFSRQARREEYLPCFCCPPNVVRIIAQANNYAYSISDKGVWVNLYGSNTLNSKLVDGTPFELSQQSRYPWCGKISLKITSLESSAEFALMLRIPEWAEGTSVKINQRAITEDITEGEYLTCQRVWQEGDIIEIDMPMESKLIEGHAFLENTHGQAAIKRGPVVYCLESIDLPEDVTIHDVVLPRNIKLKAAHNSDLLAGATTLKGKILIKQSNGDRLYAPASKERLKSVETQFIPYYSWSNRERTNMSVWLPLSY
ncbi:MAG: beta-L-arabinofuranosidase domain-containing protein [Rikenellaceae bacterium]